MELVYDIITNKDVIENNNNILEQIINLDLQNKQNKLDKDDYFKIIENQNNINLIQQFMNNIFNINDKNNIGKSILTAYYLSGYSNEIFQLYMTTRDEKIVKYSHKIVEYMENLFSTKNIDIFELSLIDRFYSLYNLWISKNTIKKIDKEYEDFIYILKNYDKLEKQFLAIEKMDQIFNIDKYLALKTFIDNYKFFYNFDKINNHFWKTVKYIENNNNSTNKYRVFVICLAEIRRKIISQSKNINTKKNMYYNIDIEDIINSIRDNSFTIDHILVITKIINNEIKNNYNISIINIKNYEKDIIRYIKDIFDNI